MATLLLDCDSLAAILRSELKGPTECFCKGDFLRLRLPLPGLGSTPMQVTGTSPTNENATKIPLKFRVSGVRRPFAWLATSCCPAWVQAKLPPFLSVKNPRTIELDVKILTESVLGLNPESLSILIQDFTMPGPQNFACHVIFKIERK